MPLRFDMRRNDVFIYLHDACFLRVLESGPPAGVLSVSRNL